MAGHRRKVTASTAGQQFRSRRLSSGDLYAVANRRCSQIEFYKKYVGTDWLSPRHLHTLIQLASYEIHGTLNLRVDGDCFHPPECWCTLTALCGTVVSRGAGGTPSEAILRAMLIRETREKKLDSAFARSDSWSGFSDIDWGLDKPMNQDAT